MHTILSEGNRALTTFRKRRGAIVVLSALMMVMLFAFLAFAIDVGFISLTRARLQNNADAAALAAAQQLSGTAEPATIRANARQAAYDVVLANVGGDAGNANFDAEQDVMFGKSTWNAGTNSYTYQWGDQYTPYTAVKVFARRDFRAAPTSADPNLVLDQRLPLFFAPVLGDAKAPVSTSAIATYVPRDIMLVLDFSHSMCYDSQFYRLGTISQDSIEESLQQIWQDLGSPVYGNMAFAPQPLVYHGVAASGSIPHIDLTWNGTSVDVTSTSNITSVKLYFSNRRSQTISGSGLSGTFKGSGSNNGKLITSAWVLSGGNANVSSGTSGEKFDFSISGLVRALGLNSVPYPYPGGSWSEFVSYCTGNSDDIENAGYKYKFGMMLWVNYIQDIHGSYEDTPDLWKTREQPTAILKNGVNLFVNYLQGLNAGDQLGLSVYSLNNSTGAKLELGLSSNLAQVATTTQQRQAGHYDPYTNIGAGMKLARQELEANARPGSFRLMVVMTDGVVNRPNNASTGTALVLSEANAAAAAHIKITTIAMGMMADTALMQQVATIGEGIAYVVPGGADYASYSQQLLSTFQDIASSQPLKLGQ